MKKKPKDHVIQLANFIGVELSNEAADCIVEKSSFKSMKENLKTTRATWRGDRSTFLRKGESGDWVHYFSQDQSDYVDAMCKQYFEPLGLELWLHKVKFYHEFSACVDKYLNWNLISVIK